MTTDEPGTISSPPGLQQLDDYVFPIPGLSPKVQTAYAVRGTKKVIKALADWSRKKPRELDKLITSLEYVASNETWRNSNHFESCAGHDGLFELKAKGATIRVFYGCVDPYLVLLWPYKHNASIREQNMEMGKARKLLQELQAMPIPEPLE